MDDKKELIRLINNIKEDKGGNLKDYMEFISFIGHLESKNNPTSVQKGSEIGKGAFQFEDKNGSNRILTAANRTKNYYKSKGMLDSMPSFINNILEKGTEDARNLTYNQQSLLLLGDARMGAADLKNYVGKGKEELSDYWATYHWAGHKGLETLKQKKIDSFSENIDDYYKEKDNILNRVSSYTGIDDLYQDRSTSDIIKENKQIVNKLEKNIDNTSIKRKPYFKEAISKDNLNLTNFIKEQRQPYFEKTFKNINKKALGGVINSLNLGDKNLNEFNTGGLHEENRLGGIPQGIGDNGKVNTVEEDETSFETSKGKFIFSNRIGLTDYINKSLKNSNNQFAEGGNINGPGDKNKKKNNSLGPTQPLEVTRELRTDINGVVSNAPLKINEVQEIPKYNKKFKNLIDVNPEIDFNSYVKNETQENFKDWFTNPETIKRIKEQTNLSDNEVNNMIIHGLTAKKSNKAMPKGLTGKYNVDNHELLYKEGDISTGFHETTHASGLDVVLGKELMNILGNPFQQEEKNTWRNIKKYMSQSHEAYSNFAQFRKDLGLKPGEKVNKNKLNKLIQKNKKAKESNFYNTFDNSKIIEAINKIAISEENKNRNIA